MTATAAINGVDLNGQWMITDASIWRPVVTTHRSLVTIPGRHGVVSTAPLTFDEAQVKYELLVEGDSTSGLEDSLNVLIGLVSQPGLVLTRVAGGGITTTDVDLMSVSEPTIYGNATQATVVVLLAVPGVFFRDEYAITAATTVNPNGAAVLYALSGGSAPITDAVVRVQGPCSSVTVTDSRGVTGLSWTGGLSASQFLFLDAGALTARRSTSADDWTSGGTPVTGALDHPAGGPLVLTPAGIPGDPLARQVGITATATGTGAGTNVTIRARRAFL